MKHRTSIVRQTFSTSLVSDVSAQLAESKFVGEASALSTLVETRADLKLVRKTAGSILPHLRPDTRDELSEELAEMVEDLHWSKSKQGKAVLEINNWSQSFRDEWRSDPRFDDMYIGTHSELHVILVAGTAKNSVDLDAAISLIESKDPPRKLLVNVSTDGESNK